MSEIRGLLSLDQCINVRLADSRKLYGFKGDPGGYRLDQIANVLQGFEVTNCYLKSGFEYLTFHRLGILHRRDEMYEVQLEHRLAERRILSLDMRLLQNYTESDVVSCDVIDKRGQCSHIADLYPKLSHGKAVSVDGAVFRTVIARWVSDVNKRSRIAKLKSLFAVQTGTVTLYDANSMPWCNLNIKRIGFQRMNPILSFSLEKT